MIQRWEKKQEQVNHMYLRLWLRSKQYYPWTKTRWIHHLLLLILFCFRWSTSKYTLSSSEKITLSTVFFLLYHQIGLVVSLSTTSLASTATVLISRLLSSTRISLFGWFRENLPQVAYFPTIIAPASLPLCTYHTWAHSSQGWSNTRRHTRFRV
jgi:hypothetical protein